MFGGARLQPDDVVDELVLLGGDGRIAERSRGLVQPEQRKVRRVCGRAVPSDGWHAERRCFDAQRKSETGSVLAWFSGASNVPSATATAASAQQAQRQT